MVELVAEVNRVDVVALQIREHDDLSTGCSSVILIALTKNMEREATHKEDHREEKSRRHEDGEEEEPCCVHKRPLCREQIR